MGKVKRLSQPEKRPRGRPPKVRIMTEKIAMDYVKKIDKLDLQGNVAENWRKFKLNWEIFLIAAELQDKSDAVKVAVLLNTLGPDAVELFQSFNLEEKKKKSYADVMEAFETFCKPKQNIVYNTFLFHNRNQHVGEPFDSFYMEIKRLVRNCDFKADEDRMLRDRIVLGTNDKNLQKRLLEADGLDLKKTVEMAKAAEATNLQVKVLSKDSGDVHVDEMKPVKLKTSRETEVKYNVNRNRKNDRKIQNNFNTCRFAQNKREVLKNCKYCDSSHERGKCPAFGKRCNNCNKMNHFAAACTNKNKPKQVKMIRNARTEAVSNSSNFYIDQLNNKQLKSESWVEKIRVENQFIKFKLDSGADVNVLPEKYFKKFKIAYDKKTDVLLEAYGGQKIQTVGEVKLTCMSKNNICSQKFYIVCADTVPILGLQACLDLKLIKRVNSIGMDRKEDFIQKNKSVFEGLGKFAEKYKIELKENATPVVKPARRIPLALQRPVKETLTQLCDRKIIESVEGASEWVSNIVVVEKPNKEIRICMDPKYLNEAIKLETHPIPSFEELVSKLANKKVFTVLDLKDGYWQICLDEASSKLCTFSTPFGCFKFNRLPFGIKTAPQVFQKFNEANFADIEGVIIYIDDILIAAENEEEHDKILKRVIKRAIEKNVKFNERKVQYKMNSVNYLGHIISAEGVAVEPSRVKAIENIQSCKNKKELQKYLGMINYMRSFIPNLAELSQPLRELLKKNVQFQWLPTHSECLNKIKLAIINAPILKIVNPNEEIVLQTDASKFGLGCCLLQNKKPISFASRSLQSAEIISKLGTVFATHGIPEEIVADNMPFSSFAFKTFAKTYDIKISTSSPHYPQSNGLAERTVQSMKNLLRKTMESKGDLWIALLEIRNTPIKDINKTPTELLMGRQTRSHIPGKQQKFQGNIDREYEEKMKKKQKRYKEYYDLRTRGKDEFNVNETVWHRNGKFWEKVIIKKKLNEPRSYIIELEDGTTVRRNSSTLRILEKKK